MNIPNNQCGGNGQINGFGQSPIVISPEVESTCHADLAGYEFEQGDCTWDHLFFQILPNGVWVGPVRIIKYICWVLIYGGLSLIYYLLTTVLSSFCNSSLYCSIHMTYDM